MAIFGKKNSGALQPKQGVDKNGRQYTRLVRPEGSEQEGRRGRIPAPQIVMQEEVDNRSDFIETSQSILNDIPKANRTNITADQLDTIHSVMQDFGTFDDDSYGMRRYLAKRDRHHEWSERGAGARLTMDLAFDGSGSVRDVHLYSISDYEEDKTYPIFYEGQAKIRTALGLVPYNRHDVKHLAERYWDSHVLPSLAGVPSDGTKFLRKEYVASIAEQPELVPEIVSELKKQPLDKINSLETYLNALGSDNEDYQPLLEKISEGKVAMAEKELDKLKSFNNSQRKAIKSNIRDTKKELDRAKRAAAKAEAN